MMPDGQQPGTVQILTADQPAGQPMPKAPATGTPAPTPPAAPAAPALGTASCGADGACCAPVICEAPCECYCAWFSAEYLLWWGKQPPTPPRVTQDPPGLLGPGTILVVGGGNADLGDFSGARFTAGAWLDKSQTLGIEGSYLFLAPNSNTQSISEDGGPTSRGLTVPFINANTGAPSFYTLSDPGFVRGGAVLTSTSQLQAADVNGLYNLSKSSSGRLDLLGGFRYLNLHESLDFGTNFVNLAGTTNNNGVPNVGGFANTQDQFTTRNNFYGGQVGAQGELCFGRFFVNAVGKVALGDMNEYVNISGSTYSNLQNNTLTGTARTTPGGIFAQPTNIGRYSRDEFAVVPEVDFNVGYKITSWARVFVGYTFLYASDVVRPGNVVDTSINTSQSSVFHTGTLVGPARPAFSFDNTDYWAQGISFGIEFRY